MAAAWSCAGLEDAGVIVISRKVNERIQINNDISIMVVEIRGDMVRLGVEAPREVPVHRGEIYDAIRQSDPRPIAHEAPDDNRSRLSSHVELSHEHAALLDRLAADAAGRLGRPVTRQQMLAAILNAVGELNVDWASLEKLEKLPPLLLAAAAQHAERDGQR
jgi:carbon storage regulator